jgi:hypothetical protein
MSANQSMITAMAELEQSVAEKLSEMRKILGMAELAPAKAKKSAGRPKKSKAEGTEAEAEAEKRAPNAFAAFVSSVNAQLRAAEEGVEKSAKAKAGTVMQFASHLWAQKKEWSPEEITAERASWEPPAISKQEAEGKSKRSGSISSGGSAAEPVTEDGKKSRKWSEEAKASAAAKRAAKKAAKPEPEVEAEAEVDVWGHVEVEAEAPAPATPAKKEAEPAAAPPAPKKAMQIKKAAPAPKKLDLSFYSITHEGADYFTNDRHDLVDAEMVWVGRLLNGKIVEAEEPEDLADATMRE